MNPGFAEGVIEGFLEAMLEEGHPGAEQALQACQLLIADNKRNRKVLSDLKIKLAGLLE